MAAPTRLHQTATATAAPGKIGGETGVQIARSASTGADVLTLRLSPGEMGRIEVRMAFAEDGNLRAIVTADNPAALDMLRRDGAQLTQALADAGVRTDGQSFRFDTRSENNGAGGYGQRQQPDAPTASAGLDKAAPSDPAPAWRNVRTRGSIDLMA